MLEKENSFLPPPSNQQVLPAWGRRPSTYSEVQRQGGCRPCGLVARLCEHRLWCGLVEERGRGCSLG